LPAALQARALRAGARIGIAAPAGAVDPDRLEAGEQALRGLGFEPVRRSDLTDRTGYLAGDDTRRAAELAELVAAPDIDAIVCARGGYGSSRLLAGLDARAFRRARKPLVGYSDITALLLWQWREAGLMGIHGPMLEREEGLPDEVGQSLRGALMGDPLPSPLSGRSGLAGRGEGRLLGGSLSLVTASLGTAWEIDTRGVILLLEEVEEPPYRIDRMLEQLRAAGKLDALAGVGIGSLQGCEDERYPDRDAEVVLREFLDPLGVPVVFDLPFGHGLRNLCWPFGARGVLDGDRGELDLLEFAVTTG
jgi:muramoyltetrapeptide carboxypeptidase